MEERLNKLNQTVDVTDADVDSQPKDAAAEVTSSLDTASGSPVTPTPLWPPGRRPFGPERRKDPAAGHRHEEARTGVAPSERLAQRRRPREAAPSHVFPYWSGK